MPEMETLNYVIADALEINLSYMPFLTDGGLFVPTNTSFNLGDKVTVNLQLPGKSDAMAIEGKVVWITPTNALHHVVTGVGIQFVGTHAATNRGIVESYLDRTMDIGGYTCGINDEIKK